jgi:hypothetical protein
MRPVKVIVVKVVGKISSAMVAGVIGTGVSPFSCDGLDEALSLAVGLRTAGPGEGVFESQFPAGLGEESGAVGGASVGEHPINFDVVSLVESNCLPESVEHAGSFLVGKKAGKGEAGVIVDGNMQALHSGAWIAHGAVARGSDAGTLKTAQFLDVEVEKLSGSGTLVADDGRPGSFERREPVEPVAAEHAGERGFGNRRDHQDLRIGAALFEHLGFQVRAGLLRLAQRSGGTVMKARWKPFFPGALEPGANGLLRDRVGSRRFAQGAVELEVLPSHLGSRERG